MIRTEDLELPADIEAAPGDPDAPGAALVTGATGFLGAAIAAELLASTDRPVWCLARPLDGAPPEERVRRALAYYELWRDEWAPRLRVVPGDITQPRCGMGDADWAAAAAEVAVVYHSGAAVNMALPYDALRAQNVVGTLEPMRLACTGRAKRFSHVSTISVFYSGRLLGAVVPDFAPLTPHYDDLVLGYAETKWVSEHLALAARDRGLDVVVTRPGALSGDTGPGVSNPNDYSWLFLKACVTLGAAPMMRAPLTWAPVDFAAKAIVHLTDLGGRDAPPGYHIMPSNEVSYLTVFSWLRRFGYDLRASELARWRRRLVEAADRAGNEELRGLVATIPDDGDDGGAAAPPVIQSDRTDPLLAEAGIACPPFDEALCARYLETGVRRGELPPAPRRRPAEVAV